MHVHSPIAIRKRKGKKSWTGKMKDERKKSHQTNATCWPQRPEPSGAFCSTFNLPFFSRCIDTVIDLFLMIWFVFYSTSFKESNSMSNYQSFKKSLPVNFMFHIKNQWQNLPPMSIRHLLKLLVSKNMFCFMFN